MKLSNPSQYIDLFPGFKIFAAFPDKEQGSAAPWHWHQDELDVGLNDKFLERQKNGWGIFFTVNELDRSLDPERKRTKRMFKRARAIWIEDDEKYTSPRTAFPIAPNIIVNSSPGKYHYYWLTSTENREEWEQVQERMVEEYGSDPNAKDVARVLRLPGYQHMKRNPYTVTYDILKVKPYDWEEIKNHFQPYIRKRDASTVHAGMEDIPGSFNEQDAIEEIITAKNFHGSFTSLAMKYANYTQNRNLIIMALESIAMKAMPNVKDDRVARLEAELRDLGRTVDTALNVVKDESDVVLQDPLPKELVTDIPWPPGLMGELSRSVYQYSPHPYKLVSIVTALALTAGVCGRKFNVSRTGLNLYITLLMPTGSGKDVIRQYISKVLSTYPSLGTGQTFVGPKRFTSPKAIVDSLKDHRSMISIQTEAGLMFKSTAGDQQGILRTILGLYSCSGKDQVSDPEAYSSKDNSLPSMKSPALTIVNEATPATFIEEITKRQSIESGELARMSIFRYEVPKPDYNFDALEFNIPPELEKRLNHMIAECMQCQATDEYEVIDIDFSKETFVNFSKACVAEENKHMHEDSLKKAMVSRAPLKVLKISACLAALEGVSYITDDQWDWSLKLYHYEMSLLSNLLDGGIDSDMDDVINNIVMPAIVKIINDRYKDKKKQMPKQYRDKGIFSYSALNQCVKNNSIIKGLKDRNKTGTQKVIEYMLYTHMLFKTSVNLTGRSTTALYQVTEEFERCWKYING